MLFIICLILLRFSGGKGDFTQYKSPDGDFDEDLDQEDIVFIGGTDAGETDTDPILDFYPEETDPGIAETILTELGVPAPSSSVSIEDEENAMAEIDLANRLAEMEEADDSAHVHVFGMENGLLQEQNFPDNPETNEDNMATSDENDDDGFETEALLTSEPQPMQTVSPYRVSTLRKRGYNEKAAMIEILAVVDNSLYKKFLAKNKRDNSRTMLAIREYFAIVVAMANERFLTIRVPGMKIQLVLTSIVVAKDRSDARWVESVVQYKRGSAVVRASTAIAKFGKWLLENKDLPSYDHAIGFTDYEMYLTQGAEAQGIAKVKGMCATSSGVSTSVVADHVDYRSPHVIAHEIAHSLGVHHDGTGKNRRCSASKNYIMSPRAFYDKNNFRNIYLFSSCSLTQMRNFLRSPQAECLYNKATPLIDYDVKENPPGRLFSADAQCKMVFGKASGICEEPSLQKTMCAHMWCKSVEDPTSCRTNGALHALPGTTCGVQKHCQRLMCVDSGPAMSLKTDRKCSRNLTTNPRRKTKVYDGSNVSNTRRKQNYRQFVVSCRDRKPNQCDVVIRSKPKLCRRTRVRKSCCQSCARYYSRS